MVDLDPGRPKKKGFRGPRGAAIIVRITGATEAIIIKDINWKKSFFKLCFQLRNSRQLVILIQYLCNITKGTMRASSSDDCVEYLFDF